MKENRQKKDYQPWRLDLISLGQGPGLGISKKYTKDYIFHLYENSRKPQIVRLVVVIAGAGVVLIANGHKGTWAGDDEKYSKAGLW